jgi:hypothetical protein
VVARAAVRAGLGVAFEEQRDGDAAVRELTDAVLKLLRGS